MKERYENIQTILASVARTGCYFLTLCDIGEEFCKDNNILPKNHIFDCLKTSLKTKWLLEDMTVMNPLAILENLTGVDWSMEKYSGLQSDVKENEYSIVCYKFGNNTHFRRRGYDVYKNSNTARMGFVLKTYIFKAAR